jgi:hypothetical protein
MEHKWKYVKDNEAPLEIDPKMIEYGYMMYPVDMGEISSEMVHQALDTNQSKIWPAVRKINPRIPIYLLKTVGDIDVFAIPPSLKKLNKLDGHSLIIGEIKIKAGANFIRMIVGFAWKSDEPFIAAIPANGVIAKKISTPKSDNLKNVNLPNTPDLKQDKSDKLWWQFWK